MRKTPHARRTRKLAVIEVFSCVLDAFELMAVMAGG